MGVCLRHVEMIVCNQSFFTDFASVCSEEVIEGKTYPVMDSPIHGEHDGASCNYALHCICKLQPFCKRL